MTYRSAPHTGDRARARALAGLGRRGQGREDPQGQVSLPAAMIHVLLRMMGSWAGGGGVVEGEKAGPGYSFQWNTVKVCTPWRGGRGRATAVIQSKGDNGFPLWLAMADAPSGQILTGAP